MLSGNGYVEFIILLKRDDFMPREESIAGALIVNILLGCIWHFITYIICISVDDSFYDADKKMYQPHKWERNGRFYSDVLKINRWKDHLPQYVGKDGFSKDHLEEVSVSYLDRFIMETCRAEWNHTMNCLYAVVLFIINDLIMAFGLTVVLFILNLPFAVIQRYNRFRLQKLRRTLIRHEKKLTC